MPLSKSPHGGKRPSAGRKPKHTQTPRRKNNKWSHLKTPTTYKRKMQMRMNYYKRKSQRLEMKTEENEDIIQHQLNEITEMRELAGSYLTNEEIDSLIYPQENQTADISKLSNDINVNMILDPLICHGVSQRNVRDTIISGANNCFVGDAETKAALLANVCCESKIRNFIKHKVHYTLSLISTIFMIISVASLACFLGYDDAERNNKSYQAITLEYEDRMNESINLKDAWKCKDVTLGKCLIGYRKIATKNTEGTVDYIRDLIDEINACLDTLSESQNKSILIEAFGEENSNYTPIDDRIESQKTDDQATNERIYRLLQPIFNYLKHKIKCIRYNLSNGVVRVKGGLKRLSQAFTELNGLSDAVSLTLFAARKFKEMSLYIHQRRSTFISAFKNEYKASVDLFVCLSLHSIRHSRGRRTSDLMGNVDEAIYLRPYLKKAVDAVYDATVILSDPAKQLIGPLAELKQIELELIVYSFTFNKVSMPTTFISEQNEINQLNGTLNVTIQEIKNNLEHKQVFAVIFGIESLSNNFYVGINSFRTTSNLYITDDPDLGKLNLKMFITNNYKLPRDKKLDETKQLKYIDASDDTVDVSKKLDLYYCHEAHHTFKHLINIQSIFI